MESAASLGLPSIVLYAVVTEGDWPGRTIETWFRADRPGIFYGECNQICGTNHSRMPIAVRAVSPEEFDKWLDEAKTKFAAAPPAAEPAQTAAIPESEPRLLAAAGVQH